MGVGLKTRDLATYLTGKVVYRTISSDDDVSSGPSVNVPQIRADIDSGRTVNTSATMRGYNSYIALYVHITSGSITPVIQLWAWGGDDASAGPQKWLHMVAQ